MNKQNAKIFTLCLLLSAGAALGLKVKEKTKKNQIKKELETVLIPNAERELDSLIFIHRSLRDSIMYFNNELQKQSQYSQIKSHLPAVQEISVLLQSISTQWHTEYSKTADEIATHKLDAFTPLHLDRRLTYLTDEIVSKPVINCRRLDFITETLQNNLESCTCYFKHNDEQDVQSEYRFLTILYTTLTHIKELSAAIDKDQNIIKKQDLILLEAKANKLLTEITKIYTSHQGQIVADKLQQLKQLKTESNIKLDKQMRKVAELKANFAVEKIYKSRHK